MPSNAPTTSSFDSFNEREIKMALTLNSRQLAHDAKNIMRETVTPAGVAAASGLMSHSVMTGLQGGRRVVVGAGLVGGGLFLGARGKGKYLPYAGIGAAMGAVWSMFDSR